MKVKTFRGLLADGGQEQIRLSTNKGEMGYKIRKFELMPNNPGVGGPESVGKIFIRQQTTIDGEVDFSNSDLLAAAFQKTQEDSANTEVGIITIFDHVVVNQDIFITMTDMRGSLKTNYYLELEQIKLSQDEAAVATLKDMRGSN